MNTFVMLSTLASILLFGMFLFNGGEHVAFALMFVAAMVWSVFAAVIHVGDVLLAILHRLPPPSEPDSLEE